MNFDFNLKDVRDCDVVVMFFLVVFDVYEKYYGMYNDWIYMWFVVGMLWGFVSLGYVVIGVVV